MTRPALFESMEQRVAAQCERILANAREQAQTILAAAEQEAAQERAQALERLAEEEAVLAAENRHRTEAQVRLERLATRQRVAGDALAGVRAKLESLAGTADFEGVLEALLAEAVESLRAEKAASEDVIVRAPQAHTERCERWLEAHGLSAMSVEAAPGLSGGIEIVRKDGGFRLANTLALRFERVQDGLRKVCIERLFREDGETQQ